jgi:hypothetical protein
MGSAAWRVRAGALVLAGALVVHELRYALVARDADAHAHAYLAWLGPFLCGVLVLTVAEFALRLARRRVDGELPPAPRFRHRWAAFAGLLMAVFALQETIEMLWAHGALDVGAAVIAHEGWLALPLAIAVGAAAAVLLRGARALAARLAADRREARPRPAPFPVRHRRGWVPPREVLARHLAGRAPPLLQT